MGEQLNFEELFEDSVSAVGEPHLACVLLLDISGSMFGGPIDSLNESINRFKEQVCQDEIAKRRVDVAIVAFASEVTVVSDFVPVGKLQEIRLEAGGNTNMADGINQAVDMVKKRNAFYQKIGIPYFKPWIFMITDGRSNSNAEDMRLAAERIREEETRGRNGMLKFWVLGISDYDRDEMYQLTKRVVELRDHDFTGIFDWLSESMTAISQSMVGEHIQLEALPENARKAREDRRIDEDWD